MKFSNGCWLQKERCECFSPAEVYFSKIEKDQVTICAPTSKITQRGDTLGGINLTIVISAPYEEVLRVQTYHHMGVQKKAPSFEIAPAESGHLKAEDTEDKLVISSGTLRLEVQKENGALTFYRGEEKITASGWRDLAYMKTDWKGFAYDKGPEDAYMREQLSLSVGELIYGLGERFSAFVKNGQSVDIWNEDGGTASEIGYKCVPFYMTNNGYGILVDSTDNVSFEVASEKVEYVGFSVPGERIKYYLFHGPSPKKIMNEYTALTGRPALPPAWSFGLWLSTSFTTNYDEETTTSFIEGMEKRNIPLSVFHFDCFWMHEFHWCDFEWDKKCFPDIRATLKKYHDKGLHICAWINPYIAQGTAFFKEGAANGYLLQRADGKGVWQTDNWQAGMGLVDFTNPDAVKWYTDKLRTVLDCGVDCFKTDFGERIPVDVVYHDGSDPQAMHNYYTYLYNQAVFSLLKEVKGENEAVLFARSATAGSQKFPVHWGGDCSANYPSMAETLRGGLSFAMSGFSFWSHDISGFESTATPDLYKRWCAFGLMSTHSRLHGSTSYRVPWLFDEEDEKNGVALVPGQTAVDVVREFTKLKLELMPYVYQLGLQPHANGTPVMRSMFVEFPDDPACRTLDRQYMFGPSMLVAPVFTYSGEVSYRFRCGCATAA